MGGESSKGGSVDGDFDAISEIRSQENEEDPISREGEGQNEWVFFGGGGEEKEGAEGQGMVSDGWSRSKDRGSLEHAILNPEYEQSFLSVGPRPQEEGKVQEERGAANDSLEAGARDRSGLSQLSPERYPSRAQGPSASSHGRAGYEVAGALSVVRDDFGQLDGSQEDDDSRLTAGRISAELLRGQQEPAAIALEEGSLGQSQAFLTQPQNLENMSRRESKRLVEDEDQSRRSSSASLQANLEYVRVGIVDENLLQDLAGIINEYVAQDDDSEAKDDEASETNISIQRIDDQPQKIKNLLTQFFQSSEEEGKQVSTDFVGRGSQFNLQRKIQELKRNLALQPVLKAVINSALDELQSQQGVGGTEGEEAREEARERVAAANNPADLIFNRIEAFKRAKKAIKTTTPSKRAAADGNQEASDNQQQIIISNLSAALMAINPTRYRNSEAVGGEEGGGERGEEEVKNLQLKPQDEMFIACAACIDSKNTNLADANELKKQIGDLKITSDSQSADAASAGDAADSVIEVAIRDLNANYPEIQVAHILPQLQEIVSEIILTSDRRREGVQGRGGGGGEEEGAGGGGVGDEEVAEGTGVFGVGGRVGEEEVAEGAGVLGDGGAALSAKEEQEENQGDNVSISSHENPEEEQKSRLRGVAKFLAGAGVLAAVGVGFWQAGVAISGAVSSSGGVAAGAGLFGFGTAATGGIFAGAAAGLATIYGTYRHLKNKSKPILFEISAEESQTRDQGRGDNFRISKDFQKTQNSQQQKSAWQRFKGLFVSENTEDYRQIRDAASKQIKDGSRLSWLNFRVIKNFWFDSDYKMKNGELNNLKISSNQESDPAADVSNNVKQKIDQAYQKCFEDAIQEYNQRFTANQIDQQKAIEIAKIAKERGGIGNIYQPDNRGFLEKTFGLNKPAKKEKSQKINDAKQEIAEFLTNTEITAGDGSKNLKYKTFLDLFEEGDNNQKANEAAKMALNFSAIYSQKTKEIGILTGRTENLKNKEAGSRLAFIPQEVLNQIGSQQNRVPQDVESTAASEVASKQARSPGPSPNPKSRRGRGFSWLPLIGRCLGRGRGGGGDGAMVV